MTAEYYYGCKWLDWAELCVCVKEGAIERRWHLGSLRLQQPGTEGQYFCCIFCVVTVLHSSKGLRWTWETEERG